MTRVSCGMERTAFALAALTFLSGVLSASDPNASPRYETYYDRVAAVRRAMRQIKPGMANDDVKQLLPLKSLWHRGGSLASAIWSDTYEVDRWHLLRLVCSDEGLISATLTRGDEVVEQVGK